MADITRTAASVRLANSPKVVDGISGEVLAENDIVRQQADGRWVQAQADSADNSAGTLGWVTRAARAADEPIQVMLSASNFTPGATGLTRDNIYVLSSANAGEIAPIADLSGTQPVIALLFALSGTTAIFRPTRIGNHF